MKLKINFTLILLGFVLACNSVDGQGQTRIVGGTKATKRYPYQVSLESPSVIVGDVVYSWHHFCGGSIISKRHIVSAAHCVVDKKEGTYTKPDELSILAGTNQLNSGGTRYYPAKIMPHPKYLTDSNSYDISVITIKGTITFQRQNIEPIRYSNEMTGGNVSCIATGWGSTGDYGEGPYPNDLQEVYTRTLTTEECQSYDTYGFITSNNLCTLKEEGEGVCDGDSGGPLVDIKKKRLVGIAEAVNGAGCGKGLPDIFTRVSAFYDWIQQNTKMSGIGSMPMV